MTAGANMNGRTRLIDLVDGIPPIRGCIVAPRRRSKMLAAGKAYHSEHRVVFLWIRGVTTLLPRRGETDARGLGKLRWVVERPLSQPHQLRRLCIRLERSSDIDQAFLALAAALVRFRKLQMEGL